MMLPHLLGHRVEALMGPTWAALEGLADEVDGLTIEVEREEGWPAT